MDEEADETTIRRENAEYLLRIGNLLSNSCPPASRFYISKLEKKLCEFPDLLKRKNNSTRYCIHCGSIWNSNNCKIRTKSCQKSNRHIKKLLKIERNENWKLNNKQKKKLKRFYNSTGKIVYRCLICQKTSFFPTSKANRASYIKSNDATTSTPVPKLKLNKSDLNAGLFIPSPVATGLNENNNLDTSDVSLDNSNKRTETSLNLCDSLNTSNTKKAMDDSLNTSNSKMSIGDSFKKDNSSPNFKTLLASSSKEQSSLKKKKTLLAQILNQEQNKKKKNSLSSFLVSL